MIRVDKAFDEDKTESRRQTIISNRKSDKYNDTLDLSLIHIFTTTMMTSAVAAMITTMSIIITTMTSAAAVMIIITIITQTKFSQAGVRRL